MVAIPTTSDKKIIPEENLIILSNKEPILKVPNALSSSGETVFNTLDYLIQFPLNILGLHNRILTET